MSSNWCNLNLDVDDSSTIAMNISGASYNQPYELPTMSAGEKGGAKVGDGLEIGDDERLSIGEYAVISNKLADGAVTTEKLEDGAVTISKIDTSAIEEINSWNKVSIASPAISGSLILVDDGTNAVLLDCGASADASLIEGFFAEHQIDIDCLVISHMDSDHVGGFETVAQYLNDETEIYIQMSPTSANGGYTTYTNAIQAVDDVVSQYSLSEPIVPSEGLVRTYGGITLELHNTTAANKGTYDATTGDSSSLTNPTSNLNNYSLISILNVGGKVITYSGDLEAVSQRLNAQYMPKADVAFMPHHLSNRWGNLEWHTNQDPQIWVATTAVSTFQHDIGYLWRYFYTLYLNDFIENVYYAHNKPLYVEFTNGSLSKLEGDTFKDALANDPPSHELSLYNILSPYYVNDNPHILYEMDLSEFMKAVARSKNGAYYKYKDSTTQNGFAFWNELLTIFTTQSSTYSGLNAEFVVDGGIVEVRFNTTQAYYDTITLYGNVDIQSGLGYRMYANGKASKYVYSTAITANSYDLTADFDIAQWVKTSNCIKVLTSGGLCIPCFRIITNADYFNVSGVSYIGYAFNTAMTTIYRVEITSAGVLKGTSRTFDSSTLSYLSIKALQAC